MRQWFFRFILMGYVSVLFLGAWGCATTQPPQFYLLSSLPASESPSSPDHPEVALFISELSPYIGVGPIDLPPYLDRPQIVTHASANALGLSEFDKWAEPLDGNVLRVLAENLSILLSTDRMVLFPWSGSIPVDYQIEANIIRFDSHPNGDPNSRFDGKL